VVGAAAAGINKFDLNLLSNAIDIAVTPDLKGIGSG
jgi:hypothetical protein